MLTPGPRSSPAAELVEASLAVLGLAVVAALDWVTGPDLSVSVFYMLPIAHVAWRISGRMGQLFALLGAGIWMTIDLLTQVDMDPAVSVWNTLVRLTFFVVVVALLDRTRKLSAQQQAMAYLDPLTHLPNSRAFRARLELEFARQRRTQAVLTVAYVDLDRFKRVNDEYGHDQGDRVLLTVAETMAASVRASDLVARIGGDEFALLLPDTDERGAEVVLQTLRTQVLDAMRAGNWGVSASIGAVSFDQPPANLDVALQRADALMYTVKREGRNAVACARFDPAAAQDVSASTSTS